MFPLQIHSKSCSFCPPRPTAPLPHSNNKIHGSPPPAAYHTATPVCGGKTVVFVGGGKSWGPSVVFLLDAVGLNWSSFEITGGIGLSGQRCLHSAISVTGEDIDNDGDPQPQQGGPLSPASAAPGDAASPPNQSEHIDDAVAATIASGELAPDVKLWNPVVPGRGAVPVSARSAGSEKGAATGSAAAKKKAGTKEGAAAAKKSGGKEAICNSSGSRSGIDNPGDDNIDGAVPDADGGAPPVFERILIFGGVVDEAAVSGVSCEWGEQASSMDHV